MGIIQGGAAACKRGPKGVKCRGAFWKGLPMVQALLVLALLAPQDSKHGGKLPWVQDFEKGLQEMKDSGGGAIVYFTKDG